LGESGVERVYYVVFKRDGKLVEAKVGRQYADAMTPAKAAAIRGDLMEGRRKTRKETRIEEAGRWTLNRLWAFFSEHKASLKSSRDDRYRYAKHIAPLMGQKDVSSLITLDVDRLRRNLSKQGLAPATVKQILVLLKRMVNLGIKKGLFSPPDPSRLSFDLPKVNNETTEDLTPKQLAAFLKVLDEDHNRDVATLMRLALFTGMRRGELFRLRWEHVDFERGFILIADPKGGRDQKIPLNAEARALLEMHPSGESPYLFPGRGGRQRTDIRKQVDRIKRKAGLPGDFRPLHGLRHVYASMLASSGQVDMYTLQKLLTHKSPAMTQRYAHLRDEALKRASDVAGELLGQIVNGNGSKKVVNLEEWRKG
jgi:integrase